MLENESYITSQNDYMKKEIANLYKSRKFSDCTFFVGNEKIHAHKLILALNSPVFERMLYGPLSSNEIDITDIEGTEFKQMLEYVYLHTVVINSIPNAWKLLYVSRKYFLNELYQLCTTYILNNLSISSLLLSYEYADFFNLLPVIKKCQNDIAHFPIEVFSNSYHMKPKSFMSILPLICSHVPIEYIQTLINTWAAEECEIQNLEETEYNKMKILQEAGICKLVLFNDIYRECINKQSEHEEMPPFHYLKLRNEYKVDRFIPFKYDCTFTTQLKVNRPVLVSGIALQVGEAKLPCLLKCLVTITIKRDEDSIYCCKNIASSGYVKLSKSVILSPEEKYKIVITYYLDTDVYCGVTSYYMDLYLENRKNGTVFELIDDSKGAVLKGISFYLF